MSNIEKLMDFINENGLDILDKFIAVLTLAGEDAGKVKELWELWEDIV